MSKSETVKRYILLVIGLFFSALGVAVTKHGELGVSPISSVANVMSCKFTVLSLGMWLILWNCVLIIGQIILLKKKFKLIQLLQIPMSFLFGLFTDFGSWMVSFIPSNAYAVKLIMVIAGTVILGLGISLCVIANVIMNSGEAFVKVLSERINKNFGNVKIAFDICCVILSVILSLVMFDFHIIGVREGTVIAAVFTGVVVKFFSKMLETPVSRLLH